MSYTEFTTVKHIFIETANLSMKKLMTVMRYRNTVNKNFALLWLIEMFQQTNT